MGLLPLGRRGESLRHRKYADENDTDTQCWERDVIDVVADLDYVVSIGGKCRHDAGFVYSDVKCRLQGVHIEDGDVGPRQEGEDGHKDAGHSPRRHQGLHLVGIDWTINESKI